MVVVFAFGGLVSRFVRTLESDRHYGILPVRPLTTRKVA